MARRRKKTRSWWRWALLGVGMLLLALLGWALGNGARLVAVEDRPYDQVGPGRGRWVMAHDVKLHLTEAGAAAAPVLVLIGGTGAWSGTWGESVAAIQRTGWRVVTLDLPPFGFSSRPADRNYSRDAQAKRVVAAIRSLGAAPVVLLGHSYGGGPAAEAAMLEPALVRHLILVDGAIGLRKPNDNSCEVSDWVATLLAWRPLRTVVVANTATQPMFTATLLEQFVARTEAVTPARLAAFREPFKVSGTSAAIGDWAYQFATSCESARSQSRAGFESLRAPLTLIWGERDHITPLSQARELVAATPGSRLIVMPGVGHIPHMEDPKLFDQRLLEVLAAIQ